MSHSELNDSECSNSWLTFEWDLMAPHRATLVPPCTITSDFGDLRVRCIKSYYCKVHHFEYFIMAIIAVLIKVPVSYASHWSYTRNKTKKICIETIAKNSWMVRDLDGIWSIQVDRRCVRILKPTCRFVNLGWMNFFN